MVALSDLIDEFDAWEMERDLAQEREQRGIPVSPEAQADSDDEGLELLRTLVELVRRDPDLKNLRNIHGGEFMGS